MEGRRRPLHQRQGLRKGAWTEEEDILLKKFISKYGEGKWHQIPRRTGLNRCRKSCRLRWLNYLRPNINRGEFTLDEVDLMIRLQKLLGNRWSIISGRLPGRTANDVKNYWNTQVRKRAQKRLSDENEKVNVIKPRPRTFSKNLRVMVLPGESPRIVSSNNNTTASTTVRSSESEADHSFLKEQQAVLSVAPDDETYYSAAAGGSGGNNNICNIISGWKSPLPPAANEISHDILAAASPLTLSWGGEASSGGAASLWAEQEQYTIDEPELAAVTVVDEFKGKGVEHHQGYNYYSMHLSDQHDDFTFDDIQLWM